MTQAEGIRLLGDLVRKRKRKEQRREAWGKFAKVFFRAALTGVLMSLLCGWYFMLAVGVIHHEWLPQLPTLGYWWSVLIAYLIRVALIRVTPPQKAKTDG
jgi:cytosine/uracil/thiamine/allantoin permease